MSSKESISPGSPARPTLRNIASRAGVSVGTVSNVIQARTFVRPDTRRKVQQAMAELGYEPEQRASGKDEPLTLGMIVPDVTNPFFGELIQSVGEIAQAAGAYLLLGSSDNDPEQEKRHIIEFRHRIDGLVLVSSRAEMDSDDAIPVSLPTVAIDRAPIGWDRDLVESDNTSGMELVVDHLVSLGHSRISFLGGDSKISTHAQRLASFVSALGSHGLTPLQVTTGAFTFLSGIEQGNLLLNDPSQRATAVVAADDVLAMGFLIAAHDRGIDVPESISVVGYDDIPYGQLTTPALTTVRQNTRELGQRGAALLLERIRGRAGSPVKRLLPVELVMRQSLTRPEEPAPSRSRRSVQAEY